ncbi:MAG: hypothetical protein ACLR3C_06185 [Eggerthella lenta]
MLGGTLPLWMFLAIALLSFTIFGGVEGRLGAHAGRPERRCTASTRSSRRATTRTGALDPATASTSRSRTWRSPTTTVPRRARCCTT